MFIWLKKHSKTINFFGGILILLTTVALYFWNTNSVEVASVGKKSLSEQRLERAQNSSHGNHKQSQKPKDITAISKKLKDGKQVENFILLLMILGFVMVIYALYGKYKETKRS